MKYIVTALIIFSLTVVPAQALTIQEQIDELYKIVEELQIKLDKIMAEKQIKKTEESITKESIEAPSKSEVKKEIKKQNTQKPLKNHRTGKLAVPMARP